MLLYSIAFFLLCAVIVYKSRLFSIEGIKKWEITSIFTLKVIAGYLFIHLYTFYYGEGNLSADAGIFINESKIISNLFFDSPWSYVKLMLGLDESNQITRDFLIETTHWDIGTEAIINDNKNVLRGNSIIHFFSFGLPIIHVMIFSLFGLLGLKYTFIFVRKHSKLNHRPILYLLVFLLPGLFFWSSTFLKEPMLFFGFSLLIMSISNPLTRWNKKIIPIVFSVFILLSFKPYVLLCLSPAILLAFVFHKLSLKKFMLFSVSSTALIIVLWFSFPDTVQNLTSRTSVKQIDFVNISKGGVYIAYDKTVFYIKEEEMSKLTIRENDILINQPTTAIKHKQDDVSTFTTIELPQSSSPIEILFHEKQSSSYFEITMINSNKNQLLKNIPEAIFNTLFRPFPSGKTPLIETPAILEYCLIYLFLIISLIFRRRLNKSEISIILGLTIFILLLSIIIGWVTPVSGAIVRYRIIIQLSIVIISMILISPTRLTKLFRSNP